MATALIKHFEGFRSNSYVCPAGVITIGYGFTASVIPGLNLNQHITVDAANRVLNRVVDGIYSDLVKSCSSLTDYPKVLAALISFAFNTGWRKGISGFSTLNGILTAGDLYSVPKSLGLYVMADGKRVPGLVIRRRAESLVAWGHAPLSAIAKAEAEHA